MPEHVATRTGSREDGQSGKSELSISGVERSQNQRTVASSDFLTEVRLDKVKVAQLILNLLPPPPHTVCVDRTNWQFGTLHINIR